MSNASLKAYKKQNEPITMSREQAKKLAYHEVTKRKDEITKEAYEDGVLKMMMVAMEVLHDQNGFGRQRLQEFYNRVNYKLACIREKFVTFEDMQAEMRMLKIDLQQMENLNLKEDTHETQ